MQFFVAQKFRKLARGTFALIAFALATIPDAAAYCATCYSVAGVGDKVAAVLQRGIAIMFVPTVAIMGFIVWRTLSSKDASANEVPLPHADISTEPYPPAPPLSSSILKPQ